MKIELLSQSTGYPITLFDVKDHLRIPRGQTNEDEYLTSLLLTATRRAEQITGRKLRLQTYKLYLDKWPDTDSIELPFYPVHNVPSSGIVYKNSDGDSTTFSSTGWLADTVSEPGRVCLEYDSQWPAVTLHNVNPISVEFRTGSTSSTGVEDTIKHAIKLMVGGWYENREDQLIVPAGQSIQELPKGVMSLLASERRSWF